MSDELLEQELTLKFWCKLRKITAIFTKCYSKFMEWNQREEQSLHELSNFNMEVQTLLMTKDLAVQ